MSLQAPSSEAQDIMARHNAYNLNDMCYILPICIMYCMYVFIGALILDTARLAWALSGDPLKQPTSLRSLLTCLEVSIRSYKIDKAVRRVPCQIAEGNFSITCLEVSIRSYRIDKAVRRVPCQIAEGNISLTCQGVRKRRHE
jgi:hypothetical protein